MTAPFQKRPRRRFYLKRQRLLFPQGFTLCLIPAPPFGGALYLIGQALIFCLLIPRLRVHFLLPRA